MALWQSSSCPGLSRASTRDVLIGLVRCLREWLEPVAREPPFTTIADFGSKGALCRRFRPKEAPLAV
jgi:hypothetical protein